MTAWSRRKGLPCWEGKGERLGEGDGNAVSRNLENSKGNGADRKTHEVKIREILMEKEENKILLKIGRRKKIFRVS